MAITLRARPVCHYCGKRNSPTNNQRKFTCQYCQADNYLDESGEIADVPASATATPRQYAVPATPAFEHAENSIFCSTCLKNQYMYNVALSEYLPDPDHPEYERFEAAIPAFKKDLERRFPTCCANCEPKVKAQLQQATYNARSDHLRRVLDRSRQRRNANRWGWRFLVVNVAGLGWFVSLVVQLIWHALGSQTDSRLEAPNIRPADCLASWPVPVECPGMLEQFIGPSILLGILCAWWNPKWQHKLEGREGKLVGLDKYYKVQGSLLALRFILWTVAKDIPQFDRLRPMIHTMSLVFIIMIAGWSRYNIISIYMPRIIDWAQDPAPLLDTKQYIPPAPQILPPNSRQAVPVSIFNTSASAGPQPWRPPTPPIDEDVMEWDPTPNAFNPSLKKVKYTSSEPSPFQGTLPEFPIGGIYRTKQDAVIEQPKAIGLPAGLFDKSHGTHLDESHKAQNTNAAFAQPRLFFESAKADTGLENIFDRVFSIQDGVNVPVKQPNSNIFGLKDEPHESERVPHSKPADQSMNHVHQNYTYVALALLITILVVFGIQDWLDLSYLHLMSIENIFSILVTITVTDIVAGGVLNLARGVYSVTSTTVLISKICGLAVLYFVQPKKDAALSTLWHQAVVGGIGGLTLTKLWEMSSFLNERTPSQSTPSLPVPPPDRALIQTEENEEQIFQQNTPKRPRQVAAISHQSVRRSSSDESIASTASIITTSTASGWKTPVRNHREELRIGASSSSYGLGGLSLQNDHDFGSGNSVAGPRTRRTPARDGQRGW